MPIKKTGSFDLSAGILGTTKAKLAEFLTEDEVSRTEIIINDGKLSFNADNSILDKITAEFGKPRERN
ncbi:hypothetical protein JQC92_00835 [Shewanella sp. 202IG2-18]|uniref:hypothetical protein n=1 Tax=Parashewanella hymeniacidonis TaxID=2807618 RepID=UPI001960F4A0|nr:hypothetical protein [Parashewanella hymeniacidonis]MBM7070590.1 hypothetical protein [Parashewanella hymeniacidonis]